MKIQIDKMFINELLTRGVAVVYPTKKALSDALMSGDRLTFYNGIDPTGPTLHVGHMIHIRKLARLQELGHRVILLIGDFTAQIGDPTDKMAVRKPLTHAQVLENCRLYRKQASRFLDFDSTDNPAEFQYNSHWLAKLNFEDTIRLASHFTVQRLLERDMFQKRIKEGKPIHVHEFLYPLMQGYDSVAMKVDGELCGNDQVFNALVGRDLVKEYLGKEKYILAAKLLVDPTGKKMGKTEGNMISMQDTPTDMYGKIMAIQDELIAVHFELLTDVPMKVVEQMEIAVKEGGNPRDFKARLAFECVKLYIDEPSAERAREQFVTVFQKKDIPLEMETFHLTRKEVTVDAKITVMELFMRTKLCSSKNEVRRLFEQKGLKINHQLVVSLNHDYHGEDELVLQKGKRYFARVVLE